MQPIISIQYLRALAAILVVIYHHNNALRELIAPNIASFHVGAFGVDIFFVISGFIMWTIAADRPTQPASFMKRRIVRIVPIYWVFTLITAFVYTDGGFRIELAQDFDRLFRSLFFIPQWHEEYTNQVAPTLIVGWTLNLEMLFYAIFAGALFLKPGLRLPVLCAVLFVMGAGELFVGDTNQPALKLYANSIVMEFGFGILLAAAYRRGLSGWITRSNSSSLWAIAMFLAAILILSLKSQLPDSRALTWGVPSLLIVAGGLFLEPILAKRPVKVFKFLGDASYSLYLSHLMAMALSMKFIGATIGADLPYLALFYRRFLRRCWAEFPISCWKSRSPKSPDICPTADLARL